MISITNARFIQVNQLPQIGSHLTAKLYVDNSIGEPSLVRNNQDNDFNDYNLTNISSITLITQAVMIIKSSLNLMWINFIGKMNDQDEM